MCLEEMRPPLKIFQCRHGHPLCQRCREDPRVRRCPCCRVELTEESVTRNILAENMAETTFGPVTTGDKPLPPPSYAEATNPEPSAPPLEPSLPPAKAPSAPLEEESIPRYLLLTSTGPAAERWSSKLGLYTLHTGCPGPGGLAVYTQAEDVMPGHQHQLRCEAGVWGVTTTSADTSYPYLRTKPRD